MSEANYDELNEKADKGELDLQAELTKYANALQQEYETKTAAKPEDVEEYTQEFFKSNIAQAAAQVVWLSINAESETVRLSSSKYIIERALAQQVIDRDPVKALLLSLKENPGKRLTPTPKPVTPTE